MLVRLIVVLGLALLALGWEGQAASACSCAMGDPRERLAEADAAFVGRLISRSDQSEVRDTRFPSLTLASYQFEVEISVKGDLGQTVEVFSPWHGASCGFEGGVLHGERVGVWLRADENGNYRSGLCSTVDPDVMLSVANPLPLPDGIRPIKFIVGGNFGNARVMALDGQGRTIAYGMGDVPTGGVTLCPGGERTVEIYGPPEDVKIGVRDLESLEMVAERGLVGDSAPSGLPGFDRLGSVGMSSEGVRAVKCLDTKGTRAAFVADQEREGWSVLAVVRIDDPLSYADVLWTSLMENALFSPSDDIAYLVRRTSEGAGTLNTFTAIDLETGSAVDLASVPLIPSDDAVREFEVSADGNHLAALIAQRGTPFNRNLVTVDLTRESAVLHQLDVDEVSSEAELLWTSGNDLFLLSNRTEHAPLLFSHSLDLIEQRDGPAKYLNETHLRDGWIHGLTWNEYNARVFVSVDTQSGEVIERRKFHYNDLQTFLAMPGDRTLAASYKPVSTATPGVSPTSPPDDRVPTVDPANEQDSGSSDDGRIRHVFGHPPGPHLFDYVVWSVAALGAAGVIIGGFFLIRRIRRST